MVFARHAWAEVITAEHLFFRMSERIVRRTCHVRFWLVRSTEVLSNEDSVAMLKVTDYTFSDDNVAGLN